MSTWSAGYVADVGYTYGYYAELNPQRINLAFLNAGIVPPENLTACELGFGQGVSANIHAAASMTEWHGTDFNPSQAAHARTMAQSGGAAVNLRDDSFAEYAARSDLPDFDFIGLHGIWSWISDENRTIIVDFIRRKLKVGGVLYISYNTLPGWSAFAPLRHIMTEHAAILGAEGAGIISRVNGALDFTGKLLVTKPQIQRALPQLAERLDKIKGQNRQYLAHEYFNRDWHPMYFATMARWLEPAKMQFACSAHLIDHVDGINFTAEQTEFLKEIPDPMLRQSVRDFMVNQQFRRDYWVKGVRQLKPLDQLERLRRLRVMLVTNRADVSLKVTGSLGEANMSEAVYGPVLDCLADHKPKSLAQIEETLRGAKIPVNQIIQAIVVLAGQGSVIVAQDDAVASKARKQSDRINAHIKAAARGSGEVVHLASPVHGGGVTVPRFHQLFLLSMEAGRKQPAELAQFVWQTLQAQGQTLIKDGQPITSPEENLTELTGQAKAFLETSLPILKALHIA